jgi:hydroxyacylglutathione hydrolase
MEITFTQIPILRDNYTFIIRDARAEKTIVIDPGSAGEVIAFLEGQGWGLTHIINTHHHWDHTDGNLELKKKYKAEIIAPLKDQKRIPGFDHGIGEGDSFAIGGVKFNVIETPGHTSGHVTFILPEHKRIYCGDVLFGFGCGGLFEGTPAQMWDSLMKIKALPDDYWVHCGHEYTVALGQSTLDNEPDNEFVRERLERCKALRKRGEATVPFLLVDDKRTNPCLRASENEFVGFYESSD